MKKLSIKTQINMKKQNGSITLYTIISMLFFLIIVSGLYINSSYRVQKQNKEIQKIQEEYKDDINDIYEKSLISNEKLLSEVVEIGDYVKYTPDTVSTTDTAYTSLISDLTTYSGNTDETQNTSSTIIQETNLNWRVLDIVKDENGNDCVRLISETPTISTVTLSSYNGYNNAVYLIDKTCNILYNNSKYTKNVQNLKIEDIQKYMEITDYSIIDTNYGKKFTTMTGYTKYPSIFVQEKEQIANGMTGTLGFSEQNEPINQTIINEATSWEVKYTYWQKLMETADYTNSKYNEIFIKDKQGNNYSSYWMSSRCVDTRSDGVVFFVRYVKDGIVGAIYLYGSAGNSYTWTYALRPVITLKSDVLIDVTKSGDGSELAKAWGLI